MNIMDLVKISRDMAQTGLTYTAPQKKPILGSLISGIFGLGSSIATNAANAAMTRETNEMNYRIAKETNQANRDLYNQQFQDSIRAWKMENEYNDPSNEVARLVRAGLNPALTFGDGASAGSVSVPSAAPAVGAEMQAPVYSDVGAAAIASMSGFADSIKAAAEARGQNKSNQYIDAEKQAAIDKARAEIGLAMSQAKKGSAEYEQLMKMSAKIDTENYIMQQTKDDVIAQRKLDTMMLKTNIAVAEEQRKNLAADSALKAAQERFQIDENSRKWTELRQSIKESVARISLMATQGSLNINQAANVFTDTVGKVIGNKQAAELFPLVKQQYEDTHGQHIWNRSMDMYGVIKTPLDAIEHAIGSGIQRSSGKR